MAAPRLSFSDLEGNAHEKLSSDTRGYQLLSDLLRQHAGINMPATEKNISLMASRLQSVLKKNQLNSYGALHEAIKSGDKRLLVVLIEALTTNKTDFFRERQHMDLLAKILPSILEENRASGRRELRIWCAAASTGQEPYTLAITLREAIPDIHLWDIKFLASDIDTKVLAYGMAGIYREQEMEGLSAQLRQKYFQVKTDGETKSFVASKTIRDMIRFAQFNLMTDPYPFAHKFDVVFCRNVLIYFDRDTQGSVVSRLNSALRPGGVLFLGHTETGVPKPTNIETLAVAAYRKTDNEG